MKRIVISATTARLVEQNLSALLDARDDKGKPSHEPKERRQWDKFADKFVEAAGTYDKTVDDLVSAAQKWGTEVLKEQAALVESLLLAWKGETPEPETVNQAVQYLKDAYKMRFDAKDREVSDAISDAEDKLGKAQCQIDLEEPQIEFLVKHWENIDLRPNRRVRRAANEFAEAIAHPTDLVQDGDRWIPKITKPTLVESEKAV